MTTASLIQGQQATLFYPGKAAAKEQVMTVARDPEQAEIRVMHDLGDFTDKDVLEIGCGDGRLTWRYAESARSVLALDPAEAAIAAARAQLPPQLMEAVRFDVADILSVRLPEAAIDIAVLSWSLC